jgi:hypothetical protein
MFWSPSGQTVHETLSPKIIRAKYSGGVPQAAECVLCEGKGLSSNSSPTKGEKKKETINSILIPSVRYLSLAIETR